jgi:succinate-semialdehyde dehydrogenase, mitochondrial
VSVNAGAAMERVRAAGLLRTRGLIGGQWVDAYDGKTIEVCVLLPLRWK